MSWETTKFSSLYAIESRNGLTKPSRVRGSGYKMINMGELFSYDRIYDIPMELVPLNDREKASSKVEPGDLLFARQSLVLEGAGKCSIVMDVSPLTVFESHLIRVRLDQTKANPLFFYYYFKSPLSPIKSIVSQCAQSGIRGSDLGELSVALPALKIQNKIADILSAYDDLIENNQKQIKLLEEAAQRLYKEWFVDLRFPGHENTPIIDGVPQGWNVRKLETFGEIITGKTPSTAKESYYNGDIPFVKIPDMHSTIYPIITESKLSEEGANTQKNKFIPKDSLMVSCIATVGLVNIAVQECQTNQQINSIILNDVRDLYYLYFSTKGLKMLLAGVGSNGATMTNVNKSKFANVEILYPTIELCEQFYDFCKPIFENILILSKSTIELKNSRDQLLPKLMSGELEV